MMWPQVHGNTCRALHYMWYSSVHTCRYTYVVWVLGRRYEMYSVCLGVGFENVPTHLPCACLHMPGNVKASFAQGKVRYITPAIVRQALTLTVRPEWFSIRSCRLRMVSQMAADHVHTIGWYARGQIVALQAALLNCWLL
jgi:hypothetical protein